MGVVLAGLVLSVLVGFLSFLCGEALAQKVYFSEAAVRRRVSSEIRSFREYVDENRIASTDLLAVENWNRDHRYTQLTIHGMSTTISSNYLGAELSISESGLLVRSGEAADEGTEFAVNFTDGSRTVLIYEASGTLVRSATAVAALLSGAAIFLLVMLVYERQLTHAIVTLSQQVTHVSREDTDTAIRTCRTDELGQLATDVENMRLSIIDRLRREEAAWQANSQLITAISHDVRTPLTAMMGYLELLEDEELTEAERSAFLQVCRSNASRLKSLTDELFGFFLVFGKPEPEVRAADCDAATLLEQLLLEYEDQLRQQGFLVNTASTAAPEGILRVDTGHIRRIFDNLCSNVRKYADPHQPVNILLQVQKDRLQLSIANSVPSEAQKVESNGIGLKTCEKLLSAMGGRLTLDAGQTAFTATVELPLYERT